MAQSLTWWDDHTDKVSRRSQRWAATDRGWLFAGRGEIAACLGHYLDYGPCSPRYAAEHAGATVHAVSCVTRKSAWCASVAAAKAWIEEQTVAALTAAA